MPVLAYATIAQNGGKIVAVAGIFTIFFKVLSWRYPGRFSTLVHHFQRATQLGCARQRGPINIENAVSASMPDIFDDGADPVGGQIWSLLGLSRRPVADAEAFAGATVWR